MNLYEKINKIMSEIEYLQKDKKAEFGSTKYNFLSEAKTTMVFRDKLIENRLVLMPIKATETKDDKVTHGIYTYRLLNADDPNDFIDLMSTGQGHDSTDKGSGKASSYAYKYLLWRTFAIPSGDDPDQITSEEIESEKEAAVRKWLFDELEAEGDPNTFTQSVWQKNFSDVPTGLLKQLHKEHVEELHKKIKQGTETLGGKLSTTKKHFPERYGVEFELAPIAVLMKCISDINLKIDGAQK